jgi:hypothetical protein
MTLHWGSAHVSACLSASPLVARILETHADPSVHPSSVPGLPIYNGETGERLMPVPLENPCRASRRKLRELFREGVSVEYGKELVGIEEKRGRGRGRWSRCSRMGRERRGMCWLRAMRRAVRRGGCIVGDEQAELKEVGVWMF